MNSLLHGTHPNNDPADFQVIDLELGEYRIEHCDYAVDICVMICRFTPLVSN